MDLLFNPIILSVVVLCLLCLVKVNVLFALIFAALTAGLSGGLGISQTMTLLTDGFSANATTALSYILLGTFAVAIAKTGLMQMLVSWISKHLGSRRLIFCLVLAFIACLSQNVVPVHIAFIPLLIPPLLSLMNKMQLDRRAAACAFACLTPAGKCRGSASAEGEARFSVQRQGTLPAAPGRRGTAGPAPPPCPAPG